jgi:hypothetical protein
VNGLLFCQGSNIEVKHLRGEIVRYRHNHIHTITGTTIAAKYYYYCCWYYSEELVDCYCPQGMSAGQS